MSAEIISRSIPPALKSITDFSFKHIEKTTLDNGIPVYYLNAGVQDVVKVVLHVQTQKNWDAGLDKYTSDAPSANSRSFVRRSRQDLPRHRASASYWIISIHTMRVRSTST